MIIKNSLAWEYFFTHESTFGVHYRTGSLGQLGLWVAGFSSHWVAGSQNVTQFHLWHAATAAVDWDLLPARSRADASGKCRSTGQTNGRTPNRYIDPVPHTAHIRRERAASTIRQGLIKRNSKVITPINLQFYLHIQAGPWNAYSENSGRILGTNLLNIFRQSHDHLSTCDRGLIYETSYEECTVFLGYNSLAKS